MQILFQNCGKTFKVKSRKISEKESNFIMTTRRATSALQWLSLPMRGSNWSHTRCIHKTLPSVTSDSFQNSKNIFLGRDFQVMKKWWMLKITGLQGLEKSSSWKLLRCLRVDVRSAFIYRGTTLKIKVTCIFVSVF